MFKRRKKPNALRRARYVFYPPGGWGRAFSYVYYRLRRIPETPGRIARGIAAGVFVSFSPLFGFHFIYAALIALIVRGNLLAAMLATFVGNPLTFPLFAAISLGLGEWILGTEATVPMSRLFAAFSQAFGQLWANLTSFLTGAEPQWDRLAVFFDGVFLPYMVGSFLPGTIAGLVAYGLAKPLIAAYQKRRARLLSRRPGGNRDARADGST